MEVTWHDLECGDYDADLALWRELAETHGGPILDVGAGTGRVTLDLARHGHAVIALDSNTALLDALRARAADEHLNVGCVEADARDFRLDAPVGLIVIPMQTMQLLGGDRGRAAFLRCAHAASRPGAILAAALADALEGFDEDHTEPPLPDMREMADGTVHLSRVVAVAPESAGVRISRIRQIVDPAGVCATEGDEILLEHGTAAAIAAQAEALGLFRACPPRAVAQTHEHVGSEVVVLCRA